MKNIFEKHIRAQIRNILSENEEKKENYNKILDLYNKVGLEGMEQDEIDFLKSGGNSKIPKKLQKPFEGGVTPKVSKELLIAYDEMWEIIKNNNIPYEDTMGGYPGYGYWNAIEIDYDDKLYNYLKNIFPEELPNEMMPIVKKTEPNYRPGVHSEKILISLIDKDNYTNWKDVPWNEL